ncbi:hypothetical protein C1H46_005692 [Malus baccata]|uniref:Uncharacterized protein n=1 Tax=Malus baccata TaxID=106549 RepID=A0A540NCE6_MALBA|nr:hypothetical protein C1H46_005692 [Malus baccata]
MTILEELEEYMAALHKLKHSVDVRTNEMLSNVRTGPTGCNFSSLMTMDNTYTTYYG